MTRFLIPSLDFGGSIPTPPLDLVGSAAAALGLRKLRTAYSGNCLKVRRSSDDTTQDIGFSGGLLDVGSLQTFCAGTNGFLDTWYDQSGNANNVTQATLADQPQIVSSGAVLTFAPNSRPRANFNGTSHHMDFGTNITADVGSYFAIANKEAAGSGYDTIHALGANTQLARTTSADLYSTYLNVDINHSTAVGAAHAVLSLVVRAANDCDLVFNGNLENKTSGSGFPSRAGSAIGGDPTSVNFLDGDIAELIFYNSALSAANRTIVEDNMGLWAGITMA